jgi:outer membrane receptor for ferrienterochelin and colicin
LIVRAGGGVYQQFADFEEVVGALAGSHIVPERSVHFDVSLEHRLSSSTRVQVAVYRREDEHVIRRPGAETRLVGGRVIRGDVSAKYENRLDGYARGVELVLQRSAPQGFSGWFSYAFGRNRYTDAVTGESYWGDLDQRHTLNAYLFYRFSHRFSASAKYRMGSNFPVPGYFTQQGEAFFLSADRNALRLPVYGRLDLRANRTFAWGRRRLTLFAEVINVLNQENVRFNPPRINTTTGQVTRLFDSLIPVVPSAGVLIEF